MTLEGQTALVTGSSRGIGAAIAVAVAAAGAHVIVHGRDAGAVERTRARIVADGGLASAETADVTDLAAVQRLRDRVIAEVGPVDILITNAGGNPTRPGRVEDMSEAAWRAAIDLNLTATFFCIRTFLPSMKERGHGSIVTMSSAAARRPDARSPIAYAAAKAGIELLTQDVAAQAGPSGVRANCLAPETIMTERNQRQIPADLQASLAEQHPLRRLGTVDDVAQAAVFLASAQASWITGIVLDVAGGAVLR